MKTSTKTHEGRVALVNLKILEYKDMEPFFIKGERDEP
jgi:hypothetical protein